MPDITNQGIFHMIEVIFYLAGPKILLSAEKRTRESIVPRLSIYICVIWVLSILYKMSNLLHSINGQYVTVYAVVHI